MSAGLYSLDHNFGGMDQLRLTAPDPASYRVLVFYSQDWEKKRRGDGYALASSALDADGRWLSPIFLVPGTYHVVATKFREHRTLAMHLTLE